MQLNGLDNRMVQRVHDELRRLEANEARTRYKNQSLKGDVELQATSSARFTSARRARTGPALCRTGCASIWASLSPKPSSCIFIFDAQVGRTCGV